MSQDSPSIAKEIGTLWTRKSGKSYFVGSSSGVFFVQTVQNAFSSAASGLHLGQRNRQASHGDAARPSWSTEWIYGNDAQADSQRNDQDHGRSVIAQLGSVTALKRQCPMPSYETARALSKAYFQTWHSLTPFLHGPSFLEDVGDMCGNNDGGGLESTDLNKEVMLRCVFHTASLDAPELQLQANRDGLLTEALLPLLAGIAVDDSLASVQALLSCQLYFIATMSLNAASITGGMISRAIMKAGLHRCPVRYSELTSADRDMRKRVFWSAYVLDRFVSQALGHPLVFQDSDVDVCNPGTHELHRPVFPRNATSQGSIEDTSNHLPSTHPERQSGPNKTESQLRFPRSRQPINTDTSGRRQTASLASADSTEQADTMPDTRSVLSEFVQSSQLLGRTLETFHKSIHVRLASTDKILLLKADLDAWANDSKYVLNNVQTMRKSTGGELANAAACKTIVFLSTFYHHITLLVHRPSLSMARSSPEFQAAIQKCVGAAKSILMILGDYIDKGFRIFWPGHLLAVWMSGLVIAFAGRIEAYDIAKAAKDISQSAKLLGNMSSRWSRAIPCQAVLLQLLESIVEDGENRSDSHAAAFSERSTAPPEPSKEPQGNGRQPNHDTGDFAPTTSASQHRRKRRRTSKMAQEGPGGLTPTQLEPVLPLPENQVANQGGEGTPRSGGDGSFERQPVPRDPLARSHVNTQSTWPYPRGNTSWQANPTEWPDIDASNSMGLQSTSGKIHPWELGTSVEMNGPVDMSMDALGWDSLQQLVTDYDWTM